MLIIKRVNVVFVAVVALVCVLLVGGYFVQRSSAIDVAEKVTLRSEHVVNHRHAHRKEEATMENILKSEYIDHIIVGYVTDATYVDGIEAKERTSPRVHFDFQVEKVLEGDLQKSEVMITGTPLEFEIGNRYLLFVEQRSSTAWPYDRFIPDDHFIFKINEQNELQRLVKFFS